MWRIAAAVLALAALAASCGGDKASSPGDDTTPSHASGDGLRDREADLRTTVKASYEALLGQDYKKFYTYFSRDFQRKCPIERFTTVMAIAAIFLGEAKGAEVTITDVRFEEDRAFVGARVKLASGEITENSAGDGGDDYPGYWVLEGGEWKSTTDDPTPCDLGDSASDDATPATGPGTSRQQAVAIGETVRLSDLEIAVLDADLDAARAVEGLTDFYEPPLAGNRYVLMRVRAKHAGAGDETETVSSNQFKLTGSRNVVYDLFGDATTCPFIDEQLDGELFPGGSIEGYVCFQAPADETGLILIAAPYFSAGNDERRYIALE